MSISFIMITARVDYPYTNRPDLHLFEPTLECFKKQEFTDFEWVIVDALYEQRKNYFTGMKLPFKVKHVPALPNIWIENGFAGMSRQFNKGIIYADGELLFFAGDGFMMQPTFMGQLWNHYNQGYFPFAWYFYDTTYVESTPDVVTLGTDIKEDASSIIDAPYNFSGYSGDCKVSVDFRFNEAFKNSKVNVYPAGWNWFYGSSAVSMEAMLKINGFDERLDGDKGLVDCDVGSRLQLAGYECRFALFRDFYLIRAVVDRSWNPSFRHNWTVKCNYALMEYARHFKQIRANTTRLTEQDIIWIKEEYCPTQPPEGCTITDFCRETHSWQFPFEHKDGYESHNSCEKWFNFWKENQTLINIAEEREKRLDGIKYQEGTFI